MQFNQHMPKML